MLAAPQRTVDHQQVTTIGESMPDKRGPGGHRRVDLRVAEAGLQGKAQRLDRRGVRAQFA